MQYPALLRELLTPVEGPDLDRVRHAFAMYASGVHSDASIAAELDLSEFHVEELLQNPLYAGRAVRHKGRPTEEERPASFPAPVEPALFGRVQRLRVERRTRHVAGGGFARRPYPLVRLLYCARCGSHYRGDACSGIRRVRHVARPACAGSLTYRADVVEEQVASLLDGIRLSDADVEAVLGLIRTPVAQHPAANMAEREERRAELQGQLSGGQISLEAFTRACGRWTGRWSSPLALTARRWRRRAVTWPTSAPCGATTTCPPS